MDRPLPFPTATPTHDYRYTFRGYHSDGAICRVRIFEPSGRPPVIMVTELPENPNTSVTNMAEYLAAELLERHFPERVGLPEPVVWIEHYPPRGKEGDDFDRVTFDDWRPRNDRFHNVWRRRAGDPDWRRLAPDEVVALIGAPEGDQHG